MIPCLLIGAFVGFVSGSVGAGGGFILIPLMIIVLRVPLKVTVGTSLGIVFIGALTGSVGKLLSLQVHIATALPLVLGAIPAAQLGAKLSKKLSSVTIHRILLMVVFASMIKVWWTVFSGSE
ncbi:MAG: sulfite exporter TauE/SafE family protein [Holophagae bacterium]|nr:sulfite exporter TauE/SafE family protein [Holophagae bacterium]